MQKNKADKIIIFGYGSKGEQIARLLHQKGYTIIVCDEDEEAYERAMDAGYESYNFSLSEDENLLEIGIQDEKLAAFFCISEDDNMNLFVTLSARNLNKKVKIISLSFKKEDNKKMLLAGADKILNPYEIGGLRIFRLLHKPFILDVMDNILFSKSDIEVAEITITKDSYLNRTYLSELDIDKTYNLVILGLQDMEISDEFIFYSKGINHKIDAGDTIVVLGKKKQIDRFRSIV